VEDEGDDAGLGEVGVLHFWRIPGVSDGIVGVRGFVVSFCQSIRQIPMALKDVL
jgi:hypothetical protein